MQTRIISAFPGTGKTEFFRKNPKNCLDSDSSDFSWIIDESENKIRNPEFPENYVQHIKDNIGKYEFILVSSHKEVREALRENCIFFYLFYPGRHKKAEYIKRFVDRGSTKEFVSQINKYFEEWVKECELTTIGCNNIYISGFLAEEIQYIINKENMHKKD